MISRVIHYGVPNTPELLRAHLKHHGVKVSSSRARRLSALYNHMLKEPVQWTDPWNSNPLANELSEYERLGRRTAQADMKILREAGLVFAFARQPSLMEMAASAGIV